MAFLRGVAAERSKFRSVRAEMTLSTSVAGSSEVQVLRKFLVEQDGGQRRFEHLKDASKPAVFICNNDGEVLAYERKTISDLEIYSLEDAKNRGILAFDPRIIGLTNVFAIDATVEQCLLLDQQPTFAVVGEEEIAGVNTTRIKLTKDIRVCEYWVTEPGFRVYRRTVAWGDKNRTSIDSEFDPTDTETPFPKRIRIHDCQVGNDFDHVVDVIRFDVAATIDPDRFAIASIELPVNTMINDYRANRIVGYWDGREISENPVSESGAPKAVTPPAPRRATPNTYRIWLIVINATLFAGILFWLWRRRT